MANKKNDPSLTDRLGKVELVFLKIEGNDATLQEAVRSFNNLISRRAHAPTTRVISALPASTSEPDAADEVTDIDETSDNGDEAVSAAVPLRADRVPKKYSVPTAISIDADRSVSFVDFLSGYALTSEQEKYLAMAAWLNAHRDETPLKAGLVLSLYKKMDWKLLSDITMPLRRLSSKAYQWFERTGPGDYKITQIGKDQLAKLKK